MPSAFLRLLSPKGQIKQRDDILQKLVLPALKRLFYLGDDQKIRGVLRPRYGYEDAIQAHFPIPEGETVKLKPVFFMGLEEGMDEIGRAHV